MNSRCIALTMLLCNITAWTAQSERENALLRKFVKQGNHIKQFQEFSKQEDVINSLNAKPLDVLQLQLNDLIKQREQAATEYDRHHDDDDFDRTQWLIDNGHIDTYNALNKIIEKKKKEQACEIPEAIRLTQTIKFVEYTETTEGKLARLKSEINRLEAKVTHAQRYDDRIQRIDDLLCKEEDYLDAYNLYQQMKEMIKQLEMELFNEKAGIPTLLQELNNSNLNTADKVTHLHKELAVFEDKFEDASRRDHRIQFVHDALTPTEYAKYLAIKAELEPLYKERPDLKPVHALLQLVSMAKTAISNGFSYIYNKLV